MPQGVPVRVPDDGLSTRQRRNRPLLIVHTGVMKGKSTAAFGLALRGWSAGWSIGVFQFVKSAKWKVGEEAAFRALHEVHQRTGQGGSVEWHKMGEGWSWARKQGIPEDHATTAVSTHPQTRDRKSTRLNSSHDQISYAVFCLKKKKKNKNLIQPAQRYNAKYNISCRYVPV